MMMKKITKTKIAVILTLVLVTITSIATPLYASAINLPETIRIGYVQGYGTIEKIDDSGISGFGYDLFQELSKYTQNTYRYEYIEVTWDDAFDKLEKGEIDVFGPVTKTDERDDRFVYTENAFAREEVYLTSSIDADIYYENIDKIDGTTVAVQTTSTTYDLLQKFLNKNDITVNCIEPSYHPIKDAIESGEYDYAVLPSICPQDGIKAVANLGVQDVYYVANDKHQNFITDLDNALVKAEKYNYLLKEKLYLKYFDNIPVANDFISPEDYNELQNNTCYTVGFSANHVPFSYINDKGEPAGVCIDVMREVAKKGGFLIDFVPIYGDKVPDIPLDISLSIKKMEYQSSIGNESHSQSYLNIPLMLVTKKNPDRDEAIGIVDYYRVSNLDISNDVDVDKLFYYSDSDRLYRDIANDTLTGAVLSTTALTSWCSGLDLNNYNVTPLSSQLSIKFTYPNGILAQSKIKIINKLLAQIEPSVIEYSLLSQTSTGEAKLTFAQVINNNKKVFISLIFWLLIALLVVYLLSQLRHKNAVTKALSVDDLSGFFSEHKFEEEATTILKENPEIRFSIVSVDIDSFKYINKVFGYETGTAVIKQFAYYLKKFFPENAIFARYTSDVFTVLTPTKGIEQKINDTIISTKSQTRRFAELLGEDYHLSFSIGLYDILDDDFDISYMVDGAVIARYFAKEQYGRTLIKFNTAMRTEYIKNTQITSKMQGAIDNHEFCLRFQPKVSLETGKITGAEALVRWLENGKLIPPSEFIPIFEKNGFIVKLDYYVARRACEFIRSQLDAGVDMPVISINLSSITVMDPNLVVNLLRIISHYKLSPKNLDLEITESAVVKDFNDAIEKISQLRSHGFTVSMDDFGAGVSSLNRLKDMPLDIIKLDRDFIRYALGDNKGIAIIKSIITMASELGLESVAEGIETGEQLSLLRDLGCDVGQGYFFSQPITSNEFLTLLEKDTCWQ